MTKPNLRIRKDGVPQIVPNRERLLSEIADLFGALFMATMGVVAAAQAVLSGAILVLAACVLVEVSRAHTARMTMRYEPAQVHSLRPSPRLLR